MAAKNRKIGAVFILFWSDELGGNFCLCIAALGNFLTLRMEYDVIYQLNQHKPNIDHESSFIAESADIVGQVELGKQVSVWFNAVIRGDTDLIKVGDRSNIQDGAVLHTDPGLQLIVGEGVTVGHNAMLHGCSIGDFSLIGINSVILNGAIIGDHTLIAANTLITEGKKIPSGVLVMGNPGKVVRELTKEEQQKLKFSAEIYTRKIQQYRHLHPVINKD